MRRTLQIFALSFLLGSSFPSYGRAAPDLSLVNGSFEVGVPWGQEDYNFLFYGLGNINLSGAGISIVSNDASWKSNGWPGVVLDKIFFSPVNATTGGIFTADVALAIPGINGGNPFPGVINPDILPPELQNTSGTFTGPSSKPLTFIFSALPVYAIVPYDPNNIVVPFPSGFTPWNYDDPLNNNGPMFSLARVGTLSLTANEPPGVFIASGVFAPVPEPETYAMLLAGLGLLGFFARRQKQEAA
jgi:hypothetical protein